MNFRLPNNGAGDTSGDQQQEWARRITNFSRERGSAEERPEILAAVARTLGASPTLPPLPAFQEKGVYFDIFTKTPDFANPPHKSPPPLFYRGG